jgi:hypothetical protein
MKSMGRPASTVVDWLPRELVTVRVARLSGTTRMDSNPSGRPSWVWHPTYDFEAMCTGGIASRTGSASLRLTWVAAAPA